MAKGNISKKQEEILQYIKDQILQRGFPPAVREICEAVHLKSTSSVHSHLETLEKNGYIRRDPTKPRAIEILDDDFNLLRRDGSGSYRGTCGGRRTDSGTAEHRRLFSVPCRVCIKQAALSFKGSRGKHGECRNPEWRLCPG